MKSILLVWILGLVAVGCVDDRVDPSSTSADSVAERASSSEQAISSERARSSEQAIAPAQPDAFSATSCAAACDTKYESCLSRAQDPLSECLCRNSQQACYTSCGLRGFPRKCAFP